MTPARPALTCQRLVSPMAEGHAGLAICGYEADSYSELKAHLGTHGKGVRG